MLVLLNAVLKQRRSLAIKRSVEGGSNTTFLTLHPIKDYSTRVETKQLEKHIYVMKDKHSIKPEKEVKIFKDDKGLFTKEVVNFQPVSLNLLEVKDFVRRCTYRVFLPRDFPNSVKDGYYHFTKYALYCGICFHIMNFLSTQALITSLNISVSQPVALSLSAGMNWVLKDGIGQLGSIFFAACFAHPIERDLKKWRIISLWMYNTSILFDCLTLLYPHYFIWIASTATLLRLSAFIASSSSRTGINAHFGRENNITDLSNKHLAQNNISFVVGSLLGLSFSVFIPMQFSSVFPLVLVLSVFHLIWAHKSCRKIFLSEMNAQRAYHVVQEYLRSGHILDHVTVNKMETLFFNKLKYLNFCNYPFDKLVHKVKKGNVLNDIIEEFRNQKFLVYAEEINPLLSVGRNKKYEIYTYLKIDAESADIFLAFLFSVNLRASLPSSDILNLMKSEVKWLEGIDKKHMTHMLHDKGWSCNFSLLEERYERIHIL